MKRATLFAILVALSVGCGWVARLEPQRAMAIPVSASPAAVLLFCSGNPVQEQTNYTVLSVDSSPNSPSISTGGSCAAAVALLVSQGFKNVKLVSHTDTNIWLLYTFIRGQEVVLDEAILPASSPTLTARSNAERSRTGAVSTPVQ
jgi:hypothetical protein